MKKKFATIISSVTLMTLAFTGCSIATTDTSGDVSSTEKKVTEEEKVDTSNVKAEGDYSGAELTVFIFAQDHEKAVYQSLIDNFTQSTGAKVNFEVTTADEYGTKMIAYKTAGDMPDVFYVGPEAVANNVDEGYLLPLDEYVSQESIDDLWPTISAAYRYDGKKVGEGSLYCLPKDLSTFAFAYNKDLFDEAGLAYPDPNKPYTWDEFREVCKKLTKDTNGDGEMDQWGSAFALQWSLDSFIYTNGATFLNEDYTKVTIAENPKFIEAFQYFTDLTAKDKITPSVEQDAALGGYQRWLDGQLGFYACGTWDVGAFMDQNTFPHKWGLCAWPVGSTGVSMTRNGSVGFAVSANTKYPEACAALITMLSTDLEGQKVLSGETTGKSLQIPNSMSYAKGDFKTAIENGKIPYGDNVDVIFNYIEGTDKYKGIFVETNYTYTNEWWQEFYNGNYQAVLDGSMTAEEYCKMIQPAMQAALDNANEQKAAASK